MDGSFRRPGSIPFKWEIQPGVPKPYSSSPSPSPSPSPKPPPHTQKLAPPPPSKKTNHYHNPSPHSSTPWLLPLPPPSLPRDLRDPSFRRSSSVSPSKLRPTSKPAHASMDSPRPRQLLVGAPVSQGCFVMPSLRRNEEKKSFGGGGGGSGKFNYMAFRLPRRSASARSLPSHYASPSYYFASSSSSSSSSSTPSRRKDGRESNDMKVAARWML